MPEHERFEFNPPSDTFWSNAAAVLFALLAATAIVVVNGTDLAARESGIRAPSAVPPSVAAEVCENCGEVIGVYATDPQLVGAPPTLESGYVVEVQMADGSFRLIKQFAPGFDPGNRVRVYGNALIAQN